MIYILIVLYNKSIKNSSTLKGIIESASILNEKKCKVFIWDNSLNRIDFNEFDFLVNCFKQFEYQHSPQNVPLSIAYNASINKSISEGFKYLMLLDDDSKIGLNFFKQIFQNVKDENYLLLPIIKNNSIIRSPVRYYILKSFIFKHLSTGNFPSKYLMAINSGMTISTEFLKQTQFKYNKKLTNYGTDNDFMRFYAAKCDRVFIINYELEHSLSFFDSSDINKKVSIFKEIKKANLIVHKDKVFELLLALSFNAISSIKYALKYRSLLFLK